MFIEKFDSMI